MSQQQQKTITDFLSEDYKDFSLYTVEQRAIPSYIDSFKPTQRKIIHVGNDIWRTGNEKPLKIFQFAGKIASDCLHYDSKILLSDGSEIIIGEWFTEFPESEFEIVCMDLNGEKTISIGFNPSSSLQKYVYELETENGVIHKLSGNHLVMLIDGTYKKVSELILEDELKMMKIKSINKIVLETPETYYDISVKDYNNFIINKSIVVHNCYYHHGNEALQNAIVNMAQKFKNNLPLLEEVGQFGTIRNPEHGAARYISTMLTKNFRLLYKDFELLTYKEEEGVKIEPVFFLPIIPTVLINGSSGIAVGFASNILNRNPVDIITACENLLKGKKINELVPYKPDFKGSYLKDEVINKRWIIRGKFERLDKKNAVKILELPPSMTYEKYDLILDALVESKLITSYDDNCKDDINYLIKFPKETYGKLTDEKIIKILKLEEAETEIFTTLDETGKLKIFETDKEIIESFVKFRLGYYLKRKEFLLNKLKNESNILKNKALFIKNILDKKIKINNVPKEDIIVQLEKIGLDKIEGNYDYLLRMPIYSLTKELYEKLNEDYRLKNIEIEALTKVEPKNMYIDDLTELKTKLIK